MIEAKCQLCREHYQSLTHAEQQTQTAKHLRAAVEIAEFALRVNNRLEQEAQGLRLLVDAGGGE